MGGTARSTVGLEAYEERHYGVQTADIGAYANEMESLQSYSNLAQGLPICKNAKHAANKQAEQ